MRGTHDNDNEPNLWSSIGLQAALIVNKLRLQAQLTEKDHAAEREQRPAGSENEKTPDNRPDAQRDYVNQRLRDVAAFERRANGKK